MKLLILLITIFPFLTKAQVSQINTQRPTTSKTKEFGLTYQMLNRDLRDNDYAKDVRQASFDSTKPEDLGYFSPSKITFEQHLIGFRYTINPKWSLEAGTSFMKSEATLTGHIPVIGPMGPTGEKIKSEFIAGSEGMSDSRVGLNYKGLNTTKHQVTYKFNLNIPTGSVEETYGPKKKHLGYSAQLGYGTYDLIPEVTWKYRDNSFIAGSRLRHTVRTGRSDADYRMGNQTLLDINAGYDYKKMVSGNLKFRVRDWENTTDPYYAARPGFIDDPYIEDGTRWELLATVKTGLPLPSKLGVILLEYGIPLYQDQDAGEVQLETAWYLNAQVIAAF